MPSRVRSGVGVARRGSRARGAAARRARDRRRQVGASLAAAAAPCCISLSSGMYEEVAAGLLVDEHLARVAEHRLHHVEVEAVARDAGRLAVFGERPT